MNIEVDQERDGDALVLLPLDRLYGENARSFELLLMRFIDGGERQVVVDCSRLTFISSAGLRVLLVSARALETNRGRLAICGMTASVEEIYRMSGLASDRPCRSFAQGGRRSRCHPAAASCARRFASRNPGDVAPADAQHPGAAAHRPAPLNPPLAATFKPSATM